MDTEKGIVWEIPKGLLRWYDFKKGGTVLYTGEANDELAELFGDAGLQVECADIGQISESGSGEYGAGKYDYIVSVAQPETQYDPVKCLNAFRALLKEGGRLLLGMNNRYGLRYFCGDRDPYTEGSYDGIEGYRRNPPENGDSFTGRCYNLHEIKTMLKKAGWPYVKTYAVLPDLRHPQLIYAEGCLPNEELSSRLFPIYNYPKSVFLEEECLYTGLAENGMFHATANAFLIECSLDGTFSDTRHVTLTPERAREEACMTIIHADNTVEKRALFPEGEERLSRMAGYIRDLKTHGIHTVDMRIENGALIMPYIQAETAQCYLKRLLREDREKFISELDRFRELILHSSEIVSEDKGDGMGAVLKKGYLDMVPLNSFYLDGDYIFYDQEFCVENCPANVIVMRMVSSLYFGNMEMEQIFPSTFFMERYGLTAELKLLEKTENEFIWGLRKENELSTYHQRKWRNYNLLNKNRKRVNFSIEDYRRIFEDIFHNVDTEKLILFGSGKYAKKFLALYRHEYRIHGLIDNNESKWGTETDGVKVYPPAYLNTLQPGEYKVIICVKDYYPIIRQLERMGVTGYSVYDPEGDYPRKRRPNIHGKASGIQVGETGGKKYHTGYVAGVFDLFHIGHLNMFKRAKEQCEYLIVGVVTDERTQRIKGKKPFIPFEERMEMVRSCRYVDEAVEIPTDYGDTRDAYRIYHFDCQFSGSDHINDPHWIAEKEFLEKHGAEMVFFSYTEGTSSTQIKALIEKELGGSRDNG